MHTLNWLAFVLLIGFVSSRHARDKRSNSGYGEGVVEAYIMAREAAEYEIEEFHKSASDPQMKPDPNTEAMQVLKQWRDKLMKLDLTEEDLQSLLRGDPGLDTDTGSAEGDDRKRSAGVMVEKRTIEKSERRRWDKAIVPYRLTDQVSEHGSNEIQRAMQTYQRWTCARYVPWENDNGTTTNDKLELGHPSHLVFVAEGGCWSYQGNMRWSGGQQISCCGGSACIHELGHAFGELHEQQTPNPDRNRFIRINWDYISDSGQPWYPQKGGSWLTSTGYDLNTYMHYATWMFNKNGGPTFSRLFPELHERGTYYYLMREVSLEHKCQDQCSDVTLTCENDGYLTKVDDRCACRCISGLDPATGCTTILKQDPPDLQFPGGQYALPAREEGCPDGFTEGSVTHYNDGENGVNNYKLKGQVEGNKAEHHFCVRDSEENGFIWPAGGYCIYRKGGNCSEGFTEGFIQYDDSNEGNNTQSGDLPDGVFGDDTRFEFCCRNTGYSGDELFLPSRKPLALIKHKDAGCQKVRGMHLAEGLARIENYEDANGTIAEVGGASPGFKKHQDKNEWWTKYCFYKPAKIDCGDVYELNAQNKEVTFSSPAGEDLECYWLIKAPQDQKLALDFTAFDVNCDDQLEVRYSRPGQPGKTYCGKSHEKTTLSINNTLHIRLSTFRGDTGSNFSATVKLIEDEDFCYSTADRGQTYTGDVSFTRDFEPCLPWHEMTHCEAHPYMTGLKFAILRVQEGNITFTTTIISNTVLEGNFCRNPDPANGFTPWCFTDKEICRRNYCDVCLFGRKYDTRSDCAQLKESGNCMMTGCAKTCADEYPEPSAPVKVGDISCPAPPDDVPDGTPHQVTKASFAVGETAAYKCNYNNGTKQRVCLSSGQWSVLGTVCSECPNGWHLNEETYHCYKLMTDAVFFEEAVSKCDEFGALLTTAKTEEEYHFVREVMPNGGWLGLHDMATEGTFLWVDGDGLNFTKWARGEPNDWGRNEDCGELGRNGYWNDLPCTGYARNFVCKKPATEPQDCLDFHNKCEELMEYQPAMCTEFPEFAEAQCRKSCSFCSDGGEVTMCQVEEPGDNAMTNDTRSEIAVGEVVTYYCNEGYMKISGDEVRGCKPSGSVTGSPLNCIRECPLEWRYLGSTQSCYRGFLDPEKTYQEAVDHCISMNGTLAPSKSSEEQDIVYASKGGGWSWLGMDDREEEGRFVWLDGSPVLETSRWNWGEPNDWGWRGEDCGMMKNNGRWNDIHCDSRMPHVCKVSIFAMESPEITTEAPPPPTTMAPPPPSTMAPPPPTTMAPPPPSTKAPPPPTTMAPPPATTEGPPKTTSPTGAPPTTGSNWHCPVVNDVYTIDKKHTAQNLGYYNAYGNKSPLPATNMFNFWDEIDWMRWLEVGHGGDIIEKCGQKALEGGFQYFGIEYYGECYLGNEADLDFEQGMVTTDCEFKCKWDVGSENVMTIFLMDSCE